MSFGQNSEVLLNLRRKQRVRDEWWKGVKEIEWSLDTRKEVVS